ncbi:MAG: hypothetical protein ACK46R_01960, partial [Bacteroidota bacterium]
DTTRIINITQAGTYWVTASNWCGTVTDTIHVNVFNPIGLDQLLGADKTLCDYQFPQRLRPLPQYENTFSNYLWSTGSDTTFTDVLLPGNYYVTAQYLCGVVTDTITLNLAPNPFLNLGNDTTLCIGQQITLNAGNHNSYTWSNQSIAPSITVNETGNYSVTVTNSFNCITNDNIQVNFVQETAQLLPNDTALYASAFPFTINLSNLYSNYQSNQFTIYNSQLTINTEGTYSLSAIDNNGCLVSDSIKISLKTFELIVPSIINKNQNFIINNLPANSSLHVFDALGQIVYQSNNYQSSQLTINNLQLTINTEGTYSLTAIDNYGCIVSDSINIKLKTFELIVPSIITKNQNLIINNLPANSSLKVFDALGQIIYQSSNCQNNFMPVMAHAMYLLELEYDADNKRKQYNGKLMVIE